MRLPILVAALCLALVVSCAPARKKTTAKKEPAPVASATGLTWGAPAASFTGLEKISEQGQTAYFNAIGSNACPMVPNCRADRVLYVFENGKLDGVLAEFTGSDQFSNIVQYLNRNLGVPVVEREAAESMVYKWKTPGDKIKLKHHQPTGDMKLGFYRR